MLQNTYQGTLQEEQNPDTSGQKTSNINPIENHFYKLDLILISPISAIIIDRMFRLFHRLATFSYKKNYPFDVPGPGDFSDIILQDVTLKKIYLSPFENAECKAQGIIFGPFARPMICLPVASMKLKKNFGIHFIVDTGSPFTYLEATALMTLFEVKDCALIQSTYVNIWGTKLIVSRATQDFKDINLLGADFFRRGQIKLQLEYSEDDLQHQIFTMQKPDNKKQVKAD